MQLQIFAAPHDWTIIGDAHMQKDQFARYYVNGTRVALARIDGVFTTLTCADGNMYYVMTSDWQEVQRLGGARIGTG
jgi:hypothetical protein